MTKEELASQFASEKIVSLNDSISDLLKEAYLRGYEEALAPVVNNPEESDLLSAIKIEYNNLDLPSGLQWSNYLGDKDCGYGRHVHNTFHFNEVQHLDLPTNDQVRELFNYTQKFGGKTGDLYKRWNYASFRSVNGLIYSLVQDQYDTGGDNLAEFWTSDKIEDDITMAFLAVITQNKEDNRIEVSFKKTFKGEKHSVVVLRKP